MFDSLFMIFSWIQSAWAQPLNHAGHRRTRGVWTRGADGRSAATQIGESCGLWSSNSFRPILKHRWMLSINQRVLPLTLFGAESSRILHQVCVSFCWCHWFAATLPRCSFGIGHCVEPRVSSKASLKLIWEGVNQRDNCCVSQKLIKASAQFLKAFVAAMMLMVQKPRKKIHEVWITLCGCLDLRNWSTVSLITMMKKDENMIESWYRRDSQVLVVATCWHQMPDAHDFESPQNHKRVEFFSMCHAGHAGFLWADRVRVSLNQRGGFALPSLSPVVSRTDNPSWTGQREIVRFGGWPKLCGASSVGPVNLISSSSWKLLAKFTSHARLEFFRGFTSRFSCGGNRKRAGEGNILYVARAVVSCTC